MSDSDLSLKSSHQRNCPSWLIGCDLCARNIQLGTNSIAVKYGFLARRGVRIDLLFSLRAAGSKLVEAAGVIVSQLCDGGYVKSPMLLWE
jgi:hypothetical protein